MKTSRLSIFVTASAALITSATAEQLESKVIHNYDQANIGFAFLGNPVIGSDADAYGFTSGVSSEVAKNLLVSLRGSSAWGSDDKLGLSGNIWGVSPSVGLILRFAENHVNLIPHVDYSYSEASISNKYDGTSHGIAGGVTLSLAKNDRFAFLVDYSFGSPIAENVNSLDYLGAHSITVGPTVRLTEKVGMFIRGNMKWLADDEIKVQTNPYAIMVGVEYHW
jgi:hypothetical protein